jgi:hypothetical protein
MNNIFYKDWLNYVYSEEYFKLTDRERKQMKMFFSKHKMFSKWKGKYKFLLIGNNIILELLQTEKLKLNGIQIQVITDDKEFKRRLKRIYVSDIDKIMNVVEKYRPVPDTKEEMKKLITLESLIPYTKETEISPDGIKCDVINTTKIDFTNAVIGRKSAETIVKRALDGEEIVTRNKEGKIETSYTTKAGDAIFINNPNDRYVPGNSDGTRWKFNELEGKGYIIVGGNIEKGEIRVKNKKSFKILHEAIKKPSCIKNAWGKGQHQYLFPGATLKLNDNGTVTGIDKSAFDSTWEILN